MSSTRDDVVAARSGDRTAFARLVGAHASAVCAVTTAILGDGAISEEVAQDVFVCAWLQLPTLREPDRFGAWLRGIARNRAREAVRNRIHRREVAGDALGQVADGAPDPVDRLDGEERARALWAALEDLDEGHREVLVLYYREGRSLDQVAHHLELPEPTVRKRLSRARERLRDGVEERLGARLAGSALRRAAFVGAVVAAIALAPLPARASTLPWAKGALGAGGLAGVVAVGLVAATWGQLRRDLPDVAAMAPPTLRVVRTAAPEGSVDPADPGAEEVPEYVVHAFLAAEDARFYDHGAVDVLSMGRAVLHDAGGGDLQGGSTLTQQLAKRVLVESMPERSVRRKAAEVVMAFELERELTKDEILERYLDGVYLGAGAYGVEAAARTYFDEPVGALTLGQGALLAGIPSAPQDHGPFTNPAGARERRDQVLEQMQARGWASADEVAAAEQEPLPVALAGSRP